MHGRDGENLSSALLLGLVALLQTPRAAKAGRQDPRRQDPNRAAEARGGLPGPRHARLARDRRGRLGLEQAEGQRLAPRPQDQHGRRDDPRSASARAPALAAGFGSLWVPNCGDQTMSRVDLKTGAVTATIKTTHRQLRRVDRRRRRQHLADDRREGHAGALRSGDQHRGRGDLRRVRIVRARLRRGRGLGDEHRAQHASRASIRAPTSSSRRFRSASRRGSSPPAAARCGR